MHTHKVEKARRQFSFMKYHGDIAKFLLEMENLNICARVTGNAAREMMEDQLP